QPEVFGGQQERHLRVVGGTCARRVELLQRLRGLARGGEGLGEQAASLRVGAVGERRCLRERFSRARELPLEPLERRHPPPTLEQGLAVMAFGGLEVALLQALFGGGD